MTPSAHPLGNRLLDQLSPRDFAGLRPHLRGVNLAVGLVVEAPDHPTGFVYFPDSGFASVITRSPEGRSLAIGMIGREGMTGHGLVLGESAPLDLTIVQAEGQGSRLDADTMDQAIAGSPSLRDHLLNHVQAFLFQVSRTMLAHATLAAQERLARWLLMAHDRVDGDQFAFGHELLAANFGLRGAGAMLALQFLQGRDLVERTGGRITILDRPGLRRVAGNSYGPAETKYDQMFGPSGASS